MHVLCTMKPNDSRRCRSLSAFAMAIVLVCLSMSSLATAEQGPTSDRRAEPAVDKKPDRPSIDDALLNDLNNELLEGAGDLKARPGQKSPAAEGDPAAPEQSAAGEDIGMPSEDHDPLIHISQEMRALESLISERTKHPHAEPIQRQIIDELSKLIEQAEQQRAQQQQSSGKDKKSQQTTKRQQVKQPKPSGNAGKDSNKPAQDSTDRLTKQEVVRPDPEALKGLMKDSWGHLPPHAREQMLQNSPERFLPKYELMIEKYYKRLAEEQKSK